MAIRVKFVKYGEHAKVKVVDEGEDMVVVPVKGGEDLRVRKVDSGEVFKVKVVRSTASTLISYAYSQPKGLTNSVPDLRTIRVFRPLSEDVKKVV